MTWLDVVALLLWLLLGLWVLILLVGAVEAAVALRDRWRARVRPARREPRPWDCACGAHAVYTAQVRIAGTVHEADRCWPTREEVR